MDGAQKSAVLMLMLKRDEAAEIIKFLTPEEIQKLGEAMAGLKSVLNEQTEEVVDDFCNVVNRLVVPPMDSDEFIRSILTQSLGDDKASTILARILGQSSDVSGIESLKWMNANSVAELIVQEHPQIIASIVVHLERSHASEILAHFSERLRNDVILRIATLEGIQPLALRELNDVMTKLVTTRGSVPKNQKGGIRAVAEILNFAPGEMESGILEHLKTYNEEMAQKVIDEMFVFENLTEVDDRSLQRIIHEIPPETLVMALKSASDGVREKIFKNMSKRAAQGMQDDLEALGPVRLSDVEEKQREIMKLVRRLSDAGQISLSRGGKETYV
jgi:flagellar motor switch protein FliG